MGGVSRREARSRPNETTLVALGAHVVWSASPVAKQCPAEPAKNAVGFVPGRVGPCATDMAEKQPSCADRYPGSSSSGRVAPGLKVFTCCSRTAAARRVRAGNYKQEIHKSPVSEDRR